MQEDTNEAFRRYAERRLYHFTQGGNLPNIMLEGGLVCKHGSVQLQKTDIAHGHIQLRRGVRKVPCGSCGTVHDYVPFYLAHRSPMLFSIQMGNVEAYRGKTPSSIVYLVSSLKQIPARGLPYVFTDGNAASSKTRFFDDPQDLGEIDWPLMSKYSWKNTDDDPDKVRRRQAELLVYNAFPWSGVEFVAVRTLRMKAFVESVYFKHRRKVKHNPPIWVRPDWYFQDVTVTSE